MAEANDIALLREFAGQNSETAFAELVRRHVNLVYSVALRFTDNDGDAQDVTQAVFILLARKAARLSARTALTGWLYETTRFTASRLLRSQVRRRAHEREASMQSILDESGADDLWRQLAPHLEAAMSRLGERDRTLLALRYYENKTGAEAAALLGIREDAARKRTNRALEKLRRFFLAHGVTSTTTAITGAISANSLQVAPAALVKTATVAAVAKGVAAPISTLTLIKGALKIMAWTKMKSAAAGAAILLVAGTTTTWVIQHESTPKPRPVDSNQTVFQRNTWRFAGYSTPESAAMSTCWALGNNDGRTFRNSMSPPLQEPFVGKPDGAVISEQNKSDFAKITGYRILDKQVLSENEVVLNCYADGLNDSQKILFLRVGNEWKYNGETKN